jgi:hypothetical protein
VAIEESNWIYSWARAPGRNPSIVLSSWNWLSEWIFNIKTGDMALTCLAFTTTAVNIIFIRRINFKMQKNNLFLMLLCFASIIFWFIFAPDFRFLGSILWIYTGLSLCLNLSILKPSNTSLLNEMIAEYEIWAKKNGVQIFVKGKSKAD